MHFALGHVYPGQHKVLMDLVTNVLVIMGEGEGCVVGTMMFYPEPFLRKDMST